MDAGVVFEFGLILSMVSMFFLNGIAIKLMFKEEIQKKRRAN